MWFAFGWCGCLGWREGRVVQYSRSRIQLRRPLHGGTLRLLSSCPFLWPHWQACGWSGSNVFYGANIAADMSSQCMALHRGEIELRTQCGGGFVIARHVAAVGNRGRERGTDSRARISTCPLVRFLCLCQMALSFQWQQIRLGDLLPAWLMAKAKPHSSGPALCPDVH